MDKLNKILQGNVTTPYSKPQPTNRTGIASPLSAYELMELNRQQTSPDPVISKFQKLGRGIKGLLVPETPIETLSIIPAVKTAKVVGKLKPKIFPNIEKYNKYDPIIEINTPIKKNPYAKKGIQSTFEKRIPIDDFLKLTTTSDKNLKNIQTSKRLSDLGSFDPKKAGSPFLEINKTGTVVGHEGRARALLAKQAGAKTMPVKIKLERFDDKTKNFEFTKIAQNYYDKNKKLPLDLKNYNIDTLKPQKFAQGQRKNYKYKIKD